MRGEAIVDGDSHDRTFHDMVYALEIICNLISISLVQQKEFHTNIDDSDEKPHEGKLRFIHKLRCVVKLVGIETEKGLYQAMVRVKSGI